jgi:uncharacterized coiled-coil DUF342 family protein
MNHRAKITKLLSERNASINEANELRAQRDDWKAASQRMAGERDRTQNDAASFSARVTALEHTVSQLARLLAGANDEIRRMKYQPKTGDVMSPQENRR